MISDGNKIVQCHNLVTVTFNESHLTGLNMQEMVNEMIQHMRYDNAYLFVLDMSSVEYIASDCLGSLVMFVRDMEHMRGRIALANCQPNVAFLFKVTRMDAVFELYDDVQSATEELLYGDDPVRGRH